MFTCVRERCEVRLDVGTTSDPDIHGVGPEDTGTGATSGTGTDNQMFISSGWLNGLDQTFWSTGGNFCKWDYNKNKMLIHKWRIGYLYNTLVEHLNTFKMCPNNKTKVQTSNISNLAIFGPSYLLIYPSLFCFGLVKVTCL